MRITLHLSCHLHQVRYDWCKIASISGPSSKEDFVIAGSFTHVEEMLLKLFTCVKEIWPSLNGYPFALKIFPQTRYESGSSSSCSRSIPTPVVEAGPCGGYARTYTACCSYFKMTQNDQLIWDINELYVTSKNTVLDLNEYVGHKYR